MVPPDGYADLRRLRTAGGSSPLARSSRSTARASWSATSPSSAYAGETARRLRPSLTRLSVRLTWDPRSHSGGLAGDPRRVGATDCLRYPVRIVSQQQGLSGHATRSSAVAARNSSRRAWHRVRIVPLQRGSTGRVQPPQASSMPGGSGQPGPGGDSPKPCSRAACIPHLQTWKPERSSWRTTFEISKTTAAFSATRTGSRGSPSRSLRSGHTRRRSWRPWLTLSTSGLLKPTETSRSSSVCAGR